MSFVVFIVITGINVTTFIYTPAGRSLNAILVKSRPFPFMTDRAVADVLFLSMNYSMSLWSHSSPTWVCSSPRITRKPIIYKTNKKQKQTKTNQQTKKRTKHKNKQTKKQPRFFHRETYLAKFLMQLELDSRDHVAKEISGTGRGKKSVSPNTSSYSEMRSGKEISMVGTELQIGDVTEKSMARRHSEVAKLTPEDRE